MNETLKFRLSFDVTSKTLNLNVPERLLEHPELLAKIQKCWKGYAEAQIGQTFLLSRDHIVSVASTVEQLLNHTCWSYYRIEELLRVQPGCPFFKCDVVPVYHNQTVTYVEIDARTGRPI